MVIESESDSKKKVMKIKTARLKEVKGDRSVLVSKKKRWQYLDGLSAGQKQDC